jgi:hypothetical protein
MQSQTFRRLALTAFVFSAGAFAGRMLGPEAVASAQQKNRVFEIRTYTTNEGKLTRSTRGCNHTTTIFCGTAWRTSGGAVGSPLAEHADHIIAHEPRAGQEELPPGADPNGEGACRVGG